ncbi:MAG: LysR family transcriptional regulator [Desulfitobacterium sp.]
MRLEQLQHIIEVAKKKSISEAAKTFLISQPQLSHSIKQLENELGYKIFRRNNTALIPTSQGKEVLALAVELLNYVEEVKISTKGTSVLYGNISLSLGPAVFNSFASPLMTHMHQIYPHVNLTITEGYAQNIIREVEEGNSMLGITGWPKGQEDTQLKLLDSKNIAYQKVLDGTFKVIVGNKHPLAQKNLVTFADLQEVTFVDYHGMNEAFLRMSGIVPKANQSLYVYDREMLKSILSANQGITIFPSFFAVNDIYFKQGLLQVRPIGDIPDNVNASIYLVYSMNEPMSFLLKQVIKTVTETIQNITQEH